MHGGQVFQILWRGQGKGRLGGSSLDLYDQLLLGQELLLRFPRTREFARIEGLIHQRCNKRECYRKTFL